MNLQQLKQLREAREKATQGEWKYAIDAPYVSLGDSNVILQVNSPDEARYIALLHNSIPEILDALEEAHEINQEQQMFFDEESEVREAYVKDLELKAEAGAYLAHKIHCHTATSRGDRQDFWSKVQRSVREYDTYIKTVSK